MQPANLMLLDGNGGIERGEEKVELVGERGESIRGAHQQVPPRSCGASESSEFVR